MGAAMRVGLVSLLQPGTVRWIDQIDPVLGYQSLAAVDLALASPNLESGWPARRRDWIGVL